MFETLVMWLVLAGATLVVACIALEGLFAILDAIGVTGRSLGRPAVGDSGPPLLDPPLHRLLIDDGIDVLLGTFQRPDELRTRLGELREHGTTGLTLLIHLPAIFSIASLMEALDDLPEVGRLVLTWSGESLPASWANPFGPPRSAVVGAGQVQPVLEPEPCVAVTGAVQRLREGETLAVLWPAEYGLASAKRLVAQGVEWRRGLVAADGEKRRARRCGL